MVNFVPAEEYFEPHYYLPHFLGADAKRSEIQDDEIRAEFDFVSRCPACGQPIDYCQGHGYMGDPVGYAIISAHDNEDHTNCHPFAECGA